MAAWSASGTEAYSCVLATELELARMEAEEECKQLEVERRSKLHNANKYALYSQRKGTEELKARRDAKKQREVADEAVARRRKAHELATAQKPIVEALELKRQKAYMETEWMDSNVVHGATAVEGAMQQRNPTTKLYKILHVLYFKEIAIVSA